MGGRGSKGEKGSGPPGSEEKGMPASPNPETSILPKLIFANCCEKVTLCNKIHDAGSRKLFPNLMRILLSKQTTEKCHFGRSQTCPAHVNAAFKAISSHRNAPRAAL